MARTANTSADARVRLIDALCDNALSAPRAEMLASIEQEYGDRRELARQFDIVLARAFEATAHHESGLPIERAGPIEPIQVPEAVLLQKVDSLGLSEQSIRRLQSAEIRQVRDLIQKSEAELLRTPNIGRRTVNEVQAALAKIGLSLGMKVAGSRSLTPQRR